MTDSTEQDPGWPEVRAVLDRALDMPAEERGSFIRRECPDSKLRGQVFSVLRVYESVTEFGPEPRTLGQPTDSDPSFGPGSRVGPYILERSLGAGGMGAVYLARRADKAFEKKVAVKLIKRQWATEGEIGRFRSERQILANLSHPSIAQLLDGGETEDGRPYLVMELVEGRTVMSYCRHHGSGLEERLDLFEQVCSAVQFAHQNLIVHRDLKPGNIMVDDSGRVKLLDFGIAKILDSAQLGITILESLPGGSPMTLAYACPEQVRGEAITTATDVYALGILLYELLTGRRPHRFDERNLVNAMEVICHQEPDSPSSALNEAATERADDPDLPKISAKQIRDDLDAIVLKALAKEPVRRYASVEQMLDDLRRFRNHEPVRARRDTLIYRSRKFMYRHRVPLGAAATVLIVLVSSLALLIQNRGELIRQNQRAELVSSWMKDFFKLPDPGRSLGEQITARELLDKSAGSIRDDLRAEPEVLVDMLATLSETYQNLGLYDRALTLIDDGIETSRGLPDGPVEEFSFRRAQTLASLGRYQEALDEASRAAAMVPAGARHALTRARYLAKRGAMETILYRPSEAERSFEAAEAEARAAGDAETLAEVLEDFAVLRRMQGRGRELEGQLEEASALREGLGYEENHPLMTALRWGLVTLKSAEDPAEAEREAQELLAAEREVQGDNEVNLGGSYLFLADIQVRAGRIDEARQSYLEGIRITEESFGGSHPRFFSLLTNYGNLEMNQGNHELAESLFLRLLDIAEKEIGTESAVYGVTLNQLGLVALRTGRLEEADELFRRSLDILAPVFGPNHEKTIMATSNVGMVEQRRGDHAAANAWFLRAAELGRGAIERPPNQTTVLLNLAKGYRLAEDLPAAGEIYEEIVRDEGLESLDGLQSLTWRARCLAETGRWAEAYSAAQQASEVWASRPEHKTWHVVARRLEGRALAGLGRHEEALVLLREALAYRRSTGASPQRIEEIRLEIQASEEALAAPSGSDAEDGAVAIEDEEAHDDQEDRKDAA